MPKKKHECSFSYPSYLFLIAFFLLIINFSTVYANDEPPVTDTDPNTSAQALISSTEDPVNSDEASANSDELVQENEVESTSPVLAHWVFNKENSRGEISDGTLVIDDLSGNNNFMQMQFYQEKDFDGEKRALESRDPEFIQSVDWSDHIKFSDNAFADKGESISFHSQGNRRQGASLVTHDQAPINKEKFLDGYTIEALFFLPNDWTEENRWMTLVGRELEDHRPLQGKVSEPHAGSMNLAVSNRRETQFKAANENADFMIPTAAWGLSMDKTDEWYYVVIRNNTLGTESFLNGGPSFRNQEPIEDNPTAYKGIYADPDDGRFRVGTSHDEKYQNPDNPDEKTHEVYRYLKGNLQEVRISNRALDQSEWLYPDTSIFVGDLGSNNDYQMNSNDGYTFVFLPDTQNTVKHRPQVYKTAIRELAGMKDSANIKAVAHLGDVVEDWDQEDQFQTASEIKVLPENGIPTIITPGNHDYIINPRQAGGEVVDPYFKKYLGQNSDFDKASDSNLVFSSPSGRSSYLTVPAGSYDYLIISASWYDLWSDPQEEEWLINVLEENPTKPTIIVSHHILGVSPEAHNAVRITTSGDGDVGRKIAEEIKNYDQVFMTFSGHHHGAGNMVEKNNYGNDILIVLADYQFSYNGGNGWFKFAEFSEDNNKIYIKTFSPYAATLSDDERGAFDINYMNGAGHDDVINFNFKERFNFENHIHDTNTQVIIETIVPVDSTLSIKEVATKDSDQVRYDINFIDQDGQVIDFTKPTKVSLPIPTGRTVSKAFHQKDSGQITYPAFSVQDGYANFTVDGFSQVGLILSPQILTNLVSDKPEQNQSLTNTQTPQTKKKKSKNQNQADPQKTPAQDTPAQKVEPSQVTNEQKHETTSLTAKKQASTKQKQLPDTGELQLLIIAYLILLIGSTLLITSKKDSLA